RELIEWLQRFEDQDAEVEVVKHKREAGYYAHGGEATSVPFEPATHAEYTDMRGNPHTKPTDPWFGSRTLLLGVLNG
ncbi:MAG: hypothetical protein HGA44_10795, partial [Cellulomonadaceae bacterium]|nr:hypothetical protein [Cellulomonadaceae bacterium]